MNLILRIAAASAFTLLATAAHAETRLTMSSWVPSGHPLFSKVMKPWAEKVEEVTEGRVKVLVLPSPLGHPKAHFDIAREGQADITYGAHGYTPGRFALYKMVEFPFSGNNAESTSVAYWRIYNEYLKPANEHKGVKLLSLFTHGPGHIHNNSKSVNSEKDIRNLKLRVGGGNISELITDLGGIAIQQPSSSSYELISNGVVDGTVFPHESVVAFNIYDKLKHTTLIPGGAYNFSFYLVMNSERFNSLSVEDQQAIESVSGETLARKAGQMWDAEDAAGFKKMQANGNETIEASESLIQAIQKSSQKIEENWYKEAKSYGVDGEAALEAFRKESRKLDLEKKEELQ